MKELLTTIALPGLGIGSMAQVTASKDADQKQEYLNKCKRQKSTGFIFLGVGLATTIGEVFMLGDAASSIDQPGVAVVETAGSGIVLALGIATTVASIPFSISSGKNRKRAMEIKASLINQPLMMKEMPIACAWNFPAVALGVNMHR